MSTVELKRNLIEKIKKIDNEDLLNDVNRLIDLETSNNDIYVLNEEEEQAIAEAENQIKNGRFLTDEEAKKDIEEWLKK
jgi:predicted transcriptional regulator